MAIFIPMRYLFLAVFIVFPQLTHAKLQGRQRTDSLLQILLKAKNDTNKVAVLNHISFEYRILDPDSGIIYGQQALELAQDLNWKKGQAIANGHIGLNYKFKSDYAKALEYLLKSLKLNEEVGYKMGLGSTLSNIGVIYQEQKDYAKALDFFQRSFKINEYIRDSANMAGDLGNIGIIYNLSSSDYATALAYEERSLKIFESLGDKEGAAHDLGNIGDVYYQQGNYAKALEYDFKALAIFEELGDKVSIAINMGNIGETYMAIAKATGEIGPKHMGPDSKLHSAIEYLTKSIAVSSDIGDLESIIEFSNYLSQAYELAGNYSEALKAYKQYTTIKDSVYSNDSQIKIAKLENQRELQVKQLEIAKKRNEQIFLTVVTGLLLIIIGIGLRKYIAQHKYNKQLAREKKRHLERIAEQTALLSQIAHTQSHEVSGPVATILGLAAIFNTENPADPDNKVIIEGITEVSAKLDKIVKGMIIKENTLNKDV